MWKWKKYQNFRFCTRTVHHSWQKFVRWINFFKFFLLFTIYILQTIWTPNFIKIGHFLVFLQFMALCTTKINNCSILDEIWRAFSLEYVNCEKQKNWKNLFFRRLFVMNGALCECTTWNFDIFFTFTNYWHVGNFKKIRDARGYVHFA